MRKAFHPDTGALTDKGRFPAEREAEMTSFSGAIGHVKNPDFLNALSIRPYLREISLN
jgi:hypothetical protein